MTDLLLWNEPAVVVRVFTGLEPEDFVQRHRNHGLSRRHIGVYGPRLSPG
jgi:hypothetical protein